MRNLVRISLLFVITLSIIVFITDNTNDTMHGMIIPFISKCDINIKSVIFNTNTFIIKYNERILKFIFN